MTTDKRTVHTDALMTLGSIIGESEKRDAIHLAVEPVTAAGALRPGEHVGFVDGGVGRCDTPVGIVDPFLVTQLRRGDRFWLFVYPRQITSLRHVWSHPAFPSTPESDPGEIKREASRAWLTWFAQTPTIDLTYNALMEGAKAFLDEGEYMIDGGKWEGFRFPTEFWTHYENVTGAKVKTRDRHSFFSCSC